MKRNLLSFTLFSILAILPVNIFAQDLQPDCKYILDFDKCRNILFALNAKGVVENFGSTTPQSFSTHSKYIYKGVLLEILNTDLVETVEFTGFAWDDYKLKAPFTDRTPDQNINWGAGKDKIIKKFGKPPEFSQMRGVDGQKIDFLFYDDKHLNFTFENGKLIKIELKRKVSDEEHARMMQKARAEEAEVEAKKTPEQKAQEIADAKARKEQQMETDYKELLAQLDAKIEEGNRIVRTETTAIAAGGMFKDAVQKKIDKVKAAGESLIDQFGKKYQGMIPDWMVKGIKAKWSGQ